jgi:hypothetical protein
MGKIPGIIAIQLKKLLRNTKFLYFLMIMDKFICHDGFAAIDPRRIHVYF